jgi:uncharacterized protein (TIGR00369 family)
MQIDTHQKIDRNLCGEPVEVGEGHSRVTFKAAGEMAVDDAGLTHGGFIFGLADYAAMIAVNHPNVVLGAAEVKFLKPVKTGDTIEAEARIVTVSGKKQMVDVNVKRGDEIVVTGVFTCFVLDKHVLHTV